MTLARFERHMRPYLQAIGAADVETLCLIREPEDWLRSWYRYRSRPDLAGHPNSTADLSFDTFVDGYLADPQPAFAAVGRPTRFVARDDGSPGVDHMFRYEAMAAAVDFLSERIGSRLDVERLNVSPERSASLGRDRQRALRDRLAADYALYETAHG